MAIEKRNAAEGTDLEKLATTKCSEVMLQEREKHIVNTRKELKEMKKGSKQWYSKTNELTGQETKVCSVPALKGPTGKWVHDPEEEANLFAETFANKYTLCEGEDNRHSILDQSKESQWQLLVRATEQA